MPEYVTREEFEARVGVLEQEVEGEKMVTRHILEQTRRNGDDLATVKTRLAGHDRRFDAIESEIRGLKAEFQGLVKSMPGIVAKAMRDVLKERPPKE